MADLNNKPEVAFDWDDAIENDGEEFIILDEGDYNFVVTGFERGRFQGGQKIPACNKASLTLQVRTEKGVANVRTDLLLYSTLEWKISSFFRCIGLKKQGEKLQMNWSKVPGARGRAHFKPRTYTANDGTERVANECTRFYSRTTHRIQDTRDLWMSRLPYRLHTARAGITSRSW